LLAGLAWCCPVAVPLDTWKRTTDSICLREQIRQSSSRTCLRILHHVKCSHAPMITEL